MLANIENERIKKLHTFIDNSDASFIVLETSEIPLQLEIIECLQNKHQNVLLIDFRNIHCTDYLQVISKSNSDIVIITNPISEFGSVENSCREINGNRDIYRNLNKIFIFLIEPCIVDYLISKCMSFWSCVELHENFTTTSFNPFLYKSMLEYSIPNTKDYDIEAFVKNEFCNNYNCNNNCTDFYPSICYYYNSSKENFDFVKWINSCIKVGDYLFNNSKFALALEYYNYAISIIAKTKNDFSTIYIRWRIANTYCQLGEYEKALFILNDLVKSEERILLLAQLYNDMGVTLIVSSKDGDDDRKRIAYECFKKSKSVLEEYSLSDVKEYLKKVYYNLALFYYNKENFKCCIDYVERLSRLGEYSTQLDYEYYYFSEFMKIKYGSYNLEDSKNALLYYHNNLPSFEKHHIILFHFCYAFYQFSKDSIRISIRELKRIEKLSKSFFESEKYYYSLYANVYYLNGVAYYYVGDMSKSNLYFAKAIRMFEKANMDVQVNKLKNLLK